MQKKTGKGKRRLTLEQVRAMPPHIQYEIYRQIAVPSPNVEPPISNGSLAQSRTTKFTSPVSITIHSARHRLADPDGISGKAAIDQLVISGILQDDSAQFVKEVRFRQTKVKGEEWTEIQISDEEE